MKKILNKLLLSILICFTLTCNFSTVEAADKNASAYFVICLYDAANNSFSYRVMEMSRDKANAAYSVYEHGERSTLDKAVSFAGSIIEKIPIIGWVANGVSDALENFFSDGSVAVSIFPDVQTIESAATVQDENQAENVVGEIVTSLNSAVAYIAQYGNVSTTNAISIATSLTSGQPSSIGSVTLTWGTSIKSKSTKAWEKIEKAVERANDTYKQGLSKYDFVLLTSSKGEELLLNYQLPKGYKNGQYLYGNSSSSSATAGGNEYFDWKTVYFLSSAAYAHNITADTEGWDAFTEPGLLESKLSEFVTATFSWGVRALGFDTVEDLILNRNTHGVTYYLGMMPYSWFKIANIIFWIFEIVAVFILLASVLNIIFKVNLQTISPAQQANLMDGIENLLISIFLLILYVPIFYILGKTNSMLVEMLDSVTGNATLLTISTLGWLAIMISGLMNLVFVIRINITYLTRAVTITLLHVIAPAAIASISIQGYQRGSFFNKWLTELIGSIFMQTFDAIVLAIFLLISQYGVATSYWQGLLFIYMFIPLNKWFKQTFTGTGGIAQVAEQTGEGAGQAVKNTAAIASATVSGGMESARYNKGVKSMQSMNSGDSESKSLEKGSMVSKESASKETDQVSTSTSTNEKQKTSKEGKEDSRKATKVVHKPGGITETTYQEMGKKSVLRGALKGATIATASAYLGKDVGSNVKNITDGLKWKGFKFKDENGKFKAQSPVELNSSVGTDESWIKTTVDPQNRSSQTNNSSSDVKLQKEQGPSYGLDNEEEPQKKKVQEPIETPKAPLEPVKQQKTNNISTRRRAYRIQQAKNHTSSPKAEGPSSSGGSDSGNDE